MSFVSIFATENIAQTIQQMKGMPLDPLGMTEVPEHACLALLEMPLLFCLTSSGWSRRAIAFPEAQCQTWQPCKEGSGTLKHMKCH